MFFFFCVFFIVLQLFSFQINLHPIELVFNRLYKVLMGFVVALTAQRRTIICLFRVFMWNPTLQRKRGALAKVAAVTFQGGADATRTTKVA